jgi:RNA polymerase sigma-70 factor (ECF subfamily)
LDKGTSHFESAKSIFSPPHASLYNYHTYSTYEKINFIDLDSHLINIINKCVKQDRQAQNELHREFYSYGLSICSRYVNDPLEARSILNQSFYKVFKNIQKYDAKLDFKPWFKTIVVNSALDYLRSNKRVSQYDTIDEKVNNTIDPTAISDLSYEDMLNVVNKLPTAYRTVFLLYVIDGYKHHEIAEKLGITESTSKSNLSRAKANLRKMITLNAA